MELKWAKVKGHFRKGVFVLSYWMVIAEGCRAGRGHTKKDALAEFRNFNQLVG